MTSTVRDTEKQLPPSPFPFILLQYLDPFEDEEITKKIIVLSLMNYMDSTIGNKTDVLAFFTHIYEMTEEEREEKAILHARSLEKEMKCHNVSSLYKRVFFHRCLVDLFHSLCRCDSLLAERDKIMNKLLPNMLKMAEILKTYSSRMLCEMGDHHLEEFCIQQLCQMIRLLDRSCNFGLFYSFIKLAYIIPYFQCILKYDDYFLWFRDSNITYEFFHSLRIMYMQSINWPELLGRLLSKLFESSVNRELESVMNGFLVGFIKRGLASKIQLVVAYLWAIDRIQTTEQKSTGVSIVSLTSYVCGLLTNIVGKTISSKKRGEENEEHTKTNVEKEDVCPALLLSIGMLRRIGCLPNGVAARSLVNSLSGIDVANIPVKHINSVLDLSRRALWVLEKEGLEKLIPPVKRFGNTLEKRMKKRIKDEDSDICSYSDRISPSKRLCLTKELGENSKCEISENDGIVIKKEFDEIIDTERRKITDSDQDIYIIESGDSGDEIYCPTPFPMRRPRKSVFNKSIKSRKLVKSVIEQIN
uniref:NopRA1 domain-containing protein n=1 Tax=Heterorhabditis bacteriophora TaxID=37862 RepID=A0A1I7WC96_HETBA